MLKLLIKLFIKDSTSVSDPKVRQAYGRLCSVYGVFLNILLFAAKLAAGILSGSMAIQADAFNNLSDAGSSLIGLFGFIIAGKKPDFDHPYGHGRSEYLAGLALSVLIILMGFELMKDAFGSIRHPQPVTAGLVPVIILLLSIGVKLYMALYNRSIGRKINSSVMEAAATDAMSDCISTAAVLLSMAVQHFYGLNIDGWTGLILSVLIMIAGIKSLRDTLSPLLGQAPDPELVKEIEQAILAFPEVLDVHDLLVHDYGPGRLMISLHAEVDGSKDIFTVHDAIDSAERQIMERFGAITTIHMDPIEANDTEVAQIRNQLIELLRELDESISIHDFRMVPGPSHTNLIFDAAVPATHPLTDRDLRHLIRDAVNEKWPDRYAVVTVDRKYV